MKKDKTNDERRSSKFLSVWTKTLGISLMCFFNIYNAMDISNENKNHLSSGSGIITQSNTESLEQATIYVTSGAIIADFSENNVETAKVKDTDKRITLRRRAIKISKHASKQAKPVAQTTAKEGKETFSSGSESDVAFIFQQNHKTACAQTQNTVVHHFSHPDSTSFQIAALDLSQIKAETCLSYVKGKINLDSFSVRPPPTRL